MILQTLFHVLCLSLVVAMPPAFAQGTINDESMAIAEAANRYMASDNPVNLSADQLHAMMANAVTTPLLISVCAADDFATAHIPGSINIPRGSFFQVTQLAKLPPRDKLIVTYCYTGTGALGPTMVLNLMGYKAMQLEWGMMGWSRNDAGLGSSTRFPASQQQLPVVTGPQGVAVTYPRPVIATGLANLNQVLIERGNTVESADRAVSMTAKAVNELLADTQSANDPFIIDIRAPADFIKGHIAQAINIPEVTIFQAGNLAKLPPGRRIVVVDYTGQTAVGISYLLSILGYNARGLQMGMMGWRTDDALLGPFKRFPAQQRDYPIDIKR